MNQQNPSAHDRPVIGLTLGDFNGVGPELLIKTLTDPRISKICIPVVYASYKILAKYKKLMELEELSFHSIRNVNELLPKKINLVTCWEEDYEISPGKSVPEAGKCAFTSISRAVEDAMAGKIDAVVTAPINKKNMQSPDFKFPGHTEYLASKTGASDSLMMMVSEEMKIAMVTAHVALSEVKNQLGKEKIVNRINQLSKALKNDFGISKPKIAVLGLNPHAGEEGLLGTEEQTIIAPVINEMREKGTLVFGPFSADGFFGAGLFNKYDAILAMYHDQGLIPFKTISFETGVNFTAGLPIVRTSPDHGTAYDIAGKGVVNENSFRQAIYLACDVVKTRKAVKV